VNIEELRDYCLQKRGATEGFPFGEDTLVFKVGEKLFILTSLAQGDRFNAKCDPERAVELRERYSEVQPGYHMNKVHWNTVFMNGSLTVKQLRDIIDHSYDLILKSLPKKVQEEIAALED
jgi:predicted DNA-binding protein (MmcQ/YjbR family)